MASATLKLFSQRSSPRTPKRRAALPPTGTTQYIPGRAFRKRQPTGSTAIQIRRYRSFEAVAGPTFTGPITCWTASRPARCGFVDYHPGRQVTVPGAPQHHLTIDYINTGDEKHLRSSNNRVEAGGMMWCKVRKRLAVLLEDAGQMVPTTQSIFSLCFPPIYRWRLQSMSRFSVSLISPRKLCIYQH